MDDKLQNESIEWDLLDPIIKKNIKNRANDAERIAEMAEDAARLAENNGDLEKADLLREKAVELRELAADIDYDPDGNVWNTGNGENVNNTDSENKNSEKDKTDNADSDSSSEEESDEKSKDNSNEEEKNKSDTSDETGDNESDNKSNDEKSNSKENNSTHKDFDELDNAGPQDEKGDQDSGVESKSDSDSSANNNSDNSNDSSKSNNEDDSDKDSKNNSDKKDSSSSDKSNDSKDDKDKKSESEQGDSGQGKENDKQAGSNRKESNDSDDSSSGDDDDGQKKDKNKNDDNSDSKNTNEPIQDIFKDKKNAQGTPGKNQKQPRLPNIKELIKQINDLDDQSKAGAIAGLEDVLANFGIDAKSLLNEKNESLTEAAQKRIPEMSAEEWSNYTNSILDIIDSVRKINYSDDLEDRKKKINQLANNKMANKQLDIEDTMSKTFDNKRDGVEARGEEENKKYDYCGTINEFKINFYNAILNQVEDVKQQYQSYDEINNEYESENIIMKADVEKEIPEEAIPIIDFYFDVSGSWKNDTEAMRIGDQAVATVREFERRGEIKLNIFYFGDWVSKTRNAGNGTNAWNEILENIKATKAKNVVLMTDGDMGGQAKHGPTCVVEGCVWNIWNLNLYAYPSRAIRTHLIGRQGNMEYSFGEGGHYDCY